MDRGGHLLAIKGNKKRNSVNRLLKFKRVSTGSTIYSESRLSNILGSCVHGGELRMSGRAVPTSLFEDIRPRRARRPYGAQILYFNIVCHPLANLHPALIATGLRPSTDVNYHVTL